MFFDFVAKIPEFVGLTWADLAKVLIGAFMVAFLAAGWVRSIRKSSKWDGQRRVHGCVVHLDIKDRKVWVQHDGTSCPVAEELVAAGIPREDIVLGFHPPDVRRHTAFAVG